MGKNHSTSFLFIAALGILSCQSPNTTSPDREMELLQKEKALLEKERDLIKQENTLLQNQKPEKTHEPGPQVQHIKPSGYDMETEFAKPFATIDGPANVRWFDDKTIIFHLANGVPINNTGNRYMSSVINRANGRGEVTEKMVDEETYGNDWQGMETIILIHEHDYAKAGVVFDENGEEYEEWEERECKHYIFKAGARLYNEQLEVIGGITTSFALCFDSMYGTAGCFSLRDSVRIDGGNYFRTNILGQTHKQNIVYSEKAPMFTEINEAVYAFERALIEKNPRIMRALFRKNGMYKHKTMFTDWINHASVGDFPDTFICIRGNGGFYWNGDFHLKKISEEKYILKDEGEYATYVIWVKENGYWVIDEVSYYEA